MEPKDIAAFFADEKNISREDYLFFDYIFECSIDPKLAAAQLCSEQSTAQWQRAGVDEDLRLRFGAKVVALEILSTSKKSRCDFPWIRGNHFTLCRVRVAHPHRNFGPRIPNLLSAMAGEGPFYCPGISTIRLCDIHFPESYLKLFEGPQFGVRGLRERLKIHDRPFFIGVVKPNIGLAPGDFAQLAFESWVGGCDIVKDDEMMADAEWSKTAERMRFAGTARKNAEKETGRPKMLVANLTDEVDEIERLYEEAEKNGANAVMLNSLFTGISALRMLRRKSKLPVMGHFTGLALFERMSHFGIDGVVLTKLQRLSGADMIVLPGFGERMQMTDESVLKNICACLEPMGNIAPALPIPGGSDAADTFPRVLEKIGHVDFGFIAGRGIYGHSGGPRAGARSLRHAWEKATASPPPL
ncbi:MAG: ribulose 1,5-bisphosphate carboxylase [Deltaproteobacteria bacterium]|nr:ribulose 1,5-bisphosphate carboxylase [Deltaproteobacteria bacterium]